MNLDICSATMGALFRSEEMTLCQFFIQTDATFWCLAELGEMGVVQFRDVCVCGLFFYNFRFNV